MQNVKFSRYIAVATTICAVLFAFKVYPYWSDIRIFNKEQVELSAFENGWLDINPDYVGYLSIDGTHIRTPVVRGSDNEKYINTTFSGMNNIVGAIFMDYRVNDGAPHIIIYGHDARRDNNNYLAFGGLAEYLSPSYLARNKFITYIEKGILYEFEVFSARFTSIWDPAYQLDFSTQNSFQDFLQRIGAPSDATRIITLSTCAARSKNMRIIVQGALKRAVAVTMERGESGWNPIERRGGFYYDGYLD